MSPVQTIKIKGYITLVAGLAFALAPGIVLALMGAAADEVGSLMMRLLGLLCAGIGWSLISTEDAVPGKQAALGYTLTDIIAACLLLLATLEGTFNIVGALLGAVYLLSSVNFIYCYVSAGEATAETP